MFTTINWVPGPPTSTLPPQTIPIGIDLGTTFSVVGFYRNEKVEFVEHRLKSEKAFLMPSVVHFDSNGGVVAGQEAVKKLDGFPTTTVYGAKTVLGRSLTDETVQRFIKEKIYPFNIVAIPDSNNMAGFEIKSGDDVKIVSPQLVSSRILLELRERAQVVLKMQVTEAVITTPASFTASQREATKQAALQAGFTKIHNINDSTAAALSYNGLRSSDPSKFVLVYDLGGGTFDVTVLQFDSEERVFHCVATNGKCNIGGNFFDQMFVEMVKDCRRSIGLPAITTPKDNAYLLKLCRHAKEELSGISETMIEYDRGEDEMPITRDALNICIGSSLRETFDLVEETISGIGVSKEQYSFVLLTGGSSRIHEIYEVLRSMFPLTTRIIQDGQFDLAVADGATRHAANVMFQGSQAAPDQAVVKDILTYTLSTSVYNKETRSVRLQKIIDKGTPLPATGSDYFSPHVDYQESLIVDVYSGESAVPTNEDLVDQSEFTLHKGLAADVSVCMKLDVDVNGMLKVTATQTMGNESTNEMVLEVGQQLHYKFSKEWQEFLKKEAETYNPVQKAHILLQTSINILSSAYGVAAMELEKSNIENKAEYLQIVQDISKTLRHSVQKAGWGQIEIEKGISSLCDVLKAFGATQKLLNVRNALANAKQQYANVVQKVLETGDASLSSPVTTFCLSTLPLKICIPRRKGISTGGMHQAHGRQTSLTAAIEEAFAADIQQPQQESEEEDEEDDDVQVLHESDSIVKKRPKLEK